MQPHYEISVIINAEQIDTLSEIFFDLGANAITLTDAKDEPLFQLSPEDQPHWQHTTLHAFFDTTIIPENIITQLKKNFPAYQHHPFSIQKIKPENWVEKTQRQFHAQSFADLWICPQWEKSAWQQSHSPQDKVVFIEPGLAFGTGTHPTTQLCLEWLATHSLKNKSVIDYGCGSGILALGALAFGAKKAWATDHDAQALTSTKNNASYNAFENKLHVLTTDEINSVQADIIVANILANPLIQLAPVLGNLLLPKGQLILSGVLATDAERVASVYEKRFNRIEMREKEGWVLMAFVLNSAASPYSFEPHTP